MIELLTLHTGYGAWNPVFYGIALVITLLIGWIIWSLGRSDFNRGKDSTAPFLFGNDEPETNTAQIRSSDLYWGFTHGLSGYYNQVRPLHTGIAADYLLAYLAVTALLTIVVVIFR